MERKIKIISTENLQKHNELLRRSSNSNSTAARNKNAKGHAKMANLNETISAIEFKKIADGEWMDVYSFNGEEYVLFAEFVDRLYGGQFRFVWDSNQNKYVEVVASHISGQNKTPKSRQAISSQVSAYGLKVGFEHPYPTINGIEGFPGAARFIKLEETKSFVEHYGNPNKCFFVTVIPQFKKFFKKFT